MKELFVNALSSLLVVCDYTEFLESGHSFIVDALLDLGCQENAARALLLERGEEEQTNASQLLEQIEQRDLEAAFELWSDDVENIEQSRKGIIDALQIGIAALNHPHRFH